jgi:RNA-splicing ligase RtcB
MIDEAPKAYKDIFEVMELQEDLVEVKDRVIPLLNIKG